MANGYGKDAYGTGPEGWGGIGAALTVVRALAISTNTVRVTLSREPVHKSVILRGDATNPATWQVTNDRGVVYTVLEATQFAPAVWDIHVLESWDVYQVTHTVGSTTLVTSNGYVIGPPNSADFPGLLSTIAAQSPQDQPPYALADLANPPFPVPSRSVAGGSFVIAQNGDYALDVGTDFYRKMVLRVISIQPNGFPWAPGWGLGLRIKEPIPAADAVSLRQAVEAKVRSIPQTADVKVQTVVDAGNNLVDLKINATPKTRAKGITRISLAEIGNVQL